MKGDASNPPGARKLAGLALAAGLIFGGVLLAAQNLGYRQDPNWKAPQNAAARKNPLAGRTDVIAGGKKLFERHCIECHGHSGQGLGHAADLQLPVVQQQTDGTLFWKITTGNARHGMPTFSGLPELQRWQLVLYLHTLKQQP